MDLVLVQNYIDAQGGGERVILELAKKFNPIIYTLAYEPKKVYPELAEFDIRLIPRHAASSFASIAPLGSDARLGKSALAGLSFLSFKIHEDYDAISAHVVPSEWIRNRNERVCWYCHGLSSPEKGWRELPEEGETLVGKAAARSYSAIGGMVVKKIERICTNSLYTSKSLNSLFKRQDGEVVYPAIDAKEFSCGEYGKFFLFVSRMLPEKRAEFAIGAFKAFSKKKKGWKLIIAGHARNSEYEHQYLDYLKSISKGAAIEFAVNRGDSEIRELYSRCFSTLFPAKCEPFGIVPLESMASSKPCISMNEGGPRESIVDGKTGFLVDSAGQMAEKMLFLADNPSGCEKMGKAGRKHVEKNFTWLEFHRKMRKAFQRTAGMG